MLYFPRMSERPKGIDHILARLERKQVATEAKIAAYKEVLQGSIPQLHDPQIPSIKSPEEMAELAERKERNLNDLQRDIARTVVPYERFFQQLAMREHVRGTQKRQIFSLHGFKAASEYDGVPFTMTYRTEQDGKGDVDFVLKTYSQRIPGVVFGDLIIDFAEGEIAKVGLHRFSDMDKLPTLQDNPTLQHGLKDKSLDRTFMHPNSMEAVLMDPDEQMPQLKFGKVGNNYWNTTYTFFVGRNEFARTNTVGLFTPKVVESLDAVTVDPKQYIELLRGALQAVPAKQLEK
jgi:hypothetical protein